MGNCVRCLVKIIPKKHDSDKTIVLLIAGLDNSGKTSILNHIQGNIDNNVLPTMGFHTVTLKYKLYSVKIYDIGGNSQIRSLWPKYYSDIHGVIFVVDSSDISRLTENKVVFGELISHRHISGKPLLLLANKQDLNGSIDELDLVENLDVEQVANSQRCPTRVETCSCLNNRDKSKNNFNGITNGYRWLLDTIIKNYITLNSRVRESETLTTERLFERQNAVDKTTYSPSRASIHSNPFKPIRELLKKAESNNTFHQSQNGISSEKIKSFFSRKNKTVPISTENLLTELDDMPQSSQSIDKNNKLKKEVPKPTDLILNPVKLDNGQDQTKHILVRPYTAPGRAQSVFRETIFTIPGQVPQ